MGGEKMTISQLIETMIGFPEGNLHDIDHLLRVWGYARTTGEQEGLDADAQYVLEAAALTHDIACPLCRERYGGAYGKRQEREGAPMVRRFLADSGMSRAQIERVSWLVGHHHTFTNVDGIDHQILLEADYIANASEGGRTADNIRRFAKTLCRTETGKRLLHAIFGV